MGISLVRDRSLDSMGRMKAISIFSVCLITISSLIIMNVREAEASRGSFGGGSGTAGDPYVIKDVWDLQNMSKDLSAHYVLGNDINASDTINWNSGAGFDPVGNSTGKFKGSLRGGGHTISGLFINRSRDENIGLFGYLDIGSYVIGVHLVEVNITGMEKVGGISGFNRGRLIDCSISGEISGYLDTGGVVGKNWYGYVSDCRADLAITANYQIGGIAGYNDFNSILTNCSATAEIRGNFHIGGIVGYNKNTVSNCTFSGFIQGNWNIGGITGYNHLDGNVSNVYANVKIMGGSDIGGIVGENLGSVADGFASGNATGQYRLGGAVGISYGTVRDCSTVFDCNGSFFIGGLIGFSTGPVSRCHAAGNVIGERNVGGLVGGNSDLISECMSVGNVIGLVDAGGSVGHNTGSMVSCHSTGNVNGLINLGGLVGSGWGDIDNSHYNIDTVKINGAHRITRGGIFEDQYRDWFENGKVLDITNYDSTLVLNDIYYEISSMAGMRDLLGFCEVEEFRFALISDLDMSDEVGFHIPYFACSEFNGNGFSIRNFSLDDLNENLALFAQVDANARIRDLNVIDCRIDGPSFVGSIAGTNRGMIIDCHVTGYISGNNYIGGLAGSNEGGIKSCTIGSSIKGDGYLGGLVGKNTGEIDNCTAKVYVNGIYFIGGLAGSNFGKVFNSTVEGTVEGNGSVGGLLGHNNMGIVLGCDSNTRVMGSYFGGGLVGSNNEGSLYNCYSKGDVSGLSKLGGLVGSNRGSISKCWSTGNVNGDENYIGGLIGQNDFLGLVSNSYSMGDLKGERSVGGLIGENGCVVSFCYSTGMVSGEEEIGGLIGANYGTVSDSFYDNHTSGMNASSGGVGKNTSDMKRRETFADAGWDLINVWSIIEHVTYPFFKEDGVERPVADAGPDIIVDQGTLVTFDGSDSYDPFGIVNYTWTFFDGSPVVLYGMRSAYRFDDAGVFIINLYVKNAYGIHDEDQITVTVRDITAPIAYAGPDQIVDEGSLVTFDGSGSLDNVGMLNYFWTFYDGGTIELNGVAPSYLFDNPGMFMVTLNVTDGSGNWATDSMTVTVRDITAPVAVAGSNLTINEGTIVYFDGGGSYDNVGIENYTWTFLDGDPIVLYGVDPGYQFDNWGIYVVTLKVTDTAGNWGISSVTITVNDITPPIAVAGPDQRVAVGSIVVLNGSLSTDNGIISRYIWTFTVNGVGVFLEGVGSSFKFDDGGVYVITLKVIDERGNVGEDQVTITVIDTGIVKGAVRDDKGNEVEGALVSITASDGREFTFTTGENGSFSLMIPHGEFDWRISKSGYVPISGTSRVDPMGEVELDLSASPLVKEKGSSPSIVPYLILAAILIVLIAGIIYILTKKGVDPRSSMEE